jgi:hypothetical protein
MRIDEIIAEREMLGSQDSLELLQQEFDGEFLDPNGNKYQWAMQFHRASVVMKALQYYNKPNYNAGTAIKAAVQDMYPDNEYVTGKKQTKDKKSKKKSDRATNTDSQVKLSAEPKKKRGAQVGNQNAVKDYTPGDGSTRQRILKKLNPTAGLNTTDLGTTFTSALGKAKSQARNLDALSINKSDFKA